MLKRLTLLFTLILFVAVACSSALDRAIEAQGAGDYETALAEYGAALEEDLDPADRFAALTGRATVYAEQSNVDASLADYAAALSVTSDDGQPAGDFARVRRARVDLLKSSGRMAEAAAELNELIALQPTDSGLLLEQAQIYTDLENWEAVVAAADAALGLDATNYEALALRGEANLQLRNFEAAIADLKASLEGDVAAASAEVASSRSGRLADAYFELGQALYSFGELEDAAANYTEALQYANDSLDEATIIAERGFVFSELDRYEEALTDLDRAISLNPNKAIAYSYRSYVYSDQENYDAAIADANRAIELSSELSAGQQSAIYHARAWANINIGEFGGAVDDATLSIELEGVDSANAARTYNLRSQAYRRLGMDSEALADANKAIELGTSDVSALDGFYVQRARVHNDMGNYEDAIADVEAAMGINEPTASRYELIGDAYWNMDDYDNAITSYQSAIQLAPDDPWLHNYLGDIYYEIDEYGSAELEYRTAIRLNENEALFHENLGFALREIENYAEAIDSFTTALAINPDAQFSWFGRGQAYYFLLEDALAIPDLQRALEYDISDSLAEYINGLLAEMGQ